MQGGYGLSAQRVVSCVYRSGRTEHSRRSSAEGLGVIGVPKPTPRAKEPKVLTSTPRPIPSRVKETVFARDDYTCQWCREPGGALDPHHRFRRGQGGKDEPRFLVSVHVLCHSYIHDHPAEAKRRGFLVSDEADLSRGWR